MFVTGTMGGLTPVLALDGRPIGDGKPGPVTARLADLFAQLTAPARARPHPGRADRGSERFQPDRGPPARIRPAAASHPRLGRPAARPPARIMTA